MKRNDSGLRAKTYLYLAFCLPISKLSESPRHPPISTFSIYISSLDVLSTSIHWRFIIPTSHCDPADLYCRFPIVDMSKTWFRTSVGGYINYLDEENYYIWAKSLKLLLKVEGLWTLVADPPNRRMRPAPLEGESLTQMMIEAQSKWDTDDAKAGAFLYFSISDRIRLELHDREKAAEIWDYLKLKKDPISSQVKRSIMMNQLLYPKMHEYETLFDFTQRILFLHRRLAGTPEALNDGTVKCRVLQCLDQSYRDFRLGKSTSNLSLEEMLEKLIEHEAISRMLDSIRAGEESTMEKSSQHSYRGSKRCR